MTTNPQVIVPTDSSSVFSALNTLVMTNNTQLAIIRPNNPPPGVAGFILDVVDEDAVDLESDITNYTVSNNTPVQDHIALMPEIVTVTGKVAELVTTNPMPEVVQPTYNPLPDFFSFIPILSDAAQRAQTIKVTAQKQEIAANDSSQSLWGYYKQRSPQQPNQTKQSLVFGYLYQLWKGRMLFTIETPWGYFTNMAIRSSSTVQPDRTRGLSTFRMTFQKIHVVESVSLKPGVLAGRAFGQQSAIDQKGILGTTTATTQQNTAFFNQILSPSP